MSKGVNLRVLTTALFFGAALVVPSKSEAQQGVRVGGIVGVNFAKLRGLDDVDLDKRTGSIAGVSLVLPLGPVLALQPEALVVTAGAEPSSGSDDGLKLSYAQIPVLLRVTPAAGAKVSPHFYAGPYVGIRIKCELDFGDLDGDCEDVGDLNTKTVDLGGIVGGGLDFNVGPMVLTGGLRYGFGVAKVADFEVGEVRESAKNGSFSIYTGAAIRFGGR